MKFLNDTPFAAEMFRSSFSDERMFNSLLVRIRYRIQGSDLALAPAEQQPRDLRHTPVEDDYGTLGEDQFYPRSGTDVIVLADAVSPDARPVEALPVRLAIGPYDWTLRVSGERVWEPRGGVLGSSRAVPFVALPLTYRFGYGGTAKTAHGAMPWANNPIGKGFYLSEDQARGQPLANIEDASVPVTAWDQRPEPAGFAPYPPSWGLRINAITEVDAAGTVRLLPERGLLDRAHPRLSGCLVPPGSELLIDGLGSEGDAGPVGTRCWRLPDCPVEVEILLGDRTFVREPNLEEIVVDLRHGVLDLAYRKLFDYRFTSRQERVTRLRMCRT